MRMPFSTLPWTPHSPHNPALITPILELSRKYGIDRMREQIQRHLESDWPQTLMDWDKLEIDTQLMEKDLVAQRIDDYFPEPASAIKLARQFNIPSILPAAFYHLSILDDWDKTHADPSLRIRNPTKRTARWELLSAKDFRCLLLGKEEPPDLVLVLKKTVEEARHRIIFGSQNKCKGDELRDICEKSSQSADPLTLIKSSNVHGCPICTKTLMTVRAYIWKRLGDVFHLKDE